MSKVRNKLEAEHDSKLATYNAHEIATLQLLFPHFKYLGTVQDSSYHTHSQAVSSHVQSKDSLFISKQILQDPSMVLFLFQCFQEARDNEMCELLSKSFDKDEIKLCGNSLLPYQIASLGFFLSHSSRNWKLLDLSGCHVGDHGINILHHYLLGHRIAIKSINLVGNNLTRLSSPFLGDMFNHVQLNELTMDWYESYSSAISTMVVNSGTVRKLSLKRCAQELLPVESMSATSFDMIMCLEKLCITRSIFNDTETEMLSEGLAKSKTLKELDLSNNSIRNTGARAIANSLMVNISLLVLDLCENHISDDGIKSLAAALRVNTSLKVLNMADNYIGEDGIRELSTALLCNNSLKELNILTSVVIGERGATAIAANFAHNTSLEVLHMAFTYNEATAIYNVLATNNTLKKPFLYLYDTDHSTYDLCSWSYQVCHKEPS